MSLTPFVFSEEQGRLLLQMMEDHFRMDFPEDRVVTPAEKGKGKGKGSPSDMVVNAPDGYLNLSSTELQPAIMNAQDTCWKQEAERALRSLSARFKHGIELVRRGPRGADGHRVCDPVPFVASYPGWKAFDDLNLDGRYNGIPAWAWMAAMCTDLRRNRPRWSLYVHESKLYVQYF